MADHESAHKPKDIIVALSVSEPSFQDKLERYFLLALLPFEGKKLTETRRDAICKVIAADVEDLEDV